ncbi:MAG: nucleotide-diphospho-sugar transferase [Flavobacteriales bacterium]|nr:nucleotide-diphospho-sugar transferase [Flavobacteriales bacterium]
MTKSMDTASSPLETAVLFLIFNRPDTTDKVFEAIRNARPPRLYLACDGPRPGKKGETELVDGLRRSLLEKVDWPCEVHTLFRDTNLGCKLAVSGAITWFFSKEEQGIILEDDCLISPTFFLFCQTLLQRYANDESVAGITADFRPLKSKNGADTFGRVGYPLIWGWASWRRVWKNYDPDVKKWTGTINDFPRLAAKPSGTQQYLKMVFDGVKEGQLDTWDFQFNFMCQLHEQDFLYPHVNMITNIGFAGNATHTDNPHDSNAMLARADVIFPLAAELPGRAYEHWLDKKVFSAKSITTKAMNRLYRWSMAMRSNS